MEKQISAISNILPVNQSEISKQIKEMIKFINQDAAEKIEELDVIAYEAFKEERNRIIEMNKVKLNALHKIKIDKIKNNNIFHQSGLWSNHRLELLKTQSYHVEDVISIVRNSFVDLSADLKSYREMVKKMILQALYQILDANVVLRTSVKDKALIESLLSECTEECRRNLKMDCKVTIDSKQFLPQSVSGGVEARTRDGKILVINTLDSKLAATAQHFTPFIKAELFKIT